MKLRREEIAKLARQMANGLKKRALLNPDVSEDEAATKIESVIVRNVEQEAAIEEEVKRIMEQYRSQIASGAVDPQKVYMMIKKQVAKERKFIL